MGDVIAIRIEDDWLRSIDRLSRETDADRRTLLRDLIRRGQKDLLQERAAALYRAGKITLSEAAHRAGLTLWEMERYLVDAGFRSQYSIDDLEREMKILG